MEEFLVWFISALGEVLLELLAEALFEIFVETIVALVVRSARNAFEESNAFVAAIGYSLLGALFGSASVWLVPHPLFHPAKIHGISLLVSPVLTGLVMSRVGVVLRRNGKEPVRIESFGYGFAFALGMAVVRLIFVR